MKFVPDDVIVCKKGSDDQVSIQFIPELVTPTVTLAKEVDDYYNDALFMSNRSAITPGLKADILSFHWPFPIERQSYYRANKLREKLNTLFPELAHPFVDPDNPLSRNSKPGGISITIGFDSEKGFSIDVGHPEPTSSKTSQRQLEHNIGTIKPVPSTWYFKDDADKIEGPFTVSALQKASHFKDCWVRREGETEWVLKSSVPELQDFEYKLITPGYREQKARRKQKAIFKDNVLVALPPMSHTPPQIARTDFANYPVPKITFKHKTFCFSGDFVFGTRQKCVDEVHSRGGKIESHPTTFTDFVVIGTMANSEWANGNYGRKIERAIELRLTHGRPAIITEQTFTRALYESESAPNP